MSLVICGKCQMPVQGKVVSAMGKSWHPEHFTCTTCNKAIVGDRFNQKDGKPYCEDDFSAQFLRRCAKCDKPIKETVVVALDKSWHPEHFQCSTCNSELAEQAFCEKDGKPYCLNDYQQQFCPRCADCQKPITDTAAIAMGSKFHRQCFKCSACKKPLDDAFQIIEGKPVCKMCGSKDNVRT